MTVPENHFGDVFFFFNYFNFDSIATLTTLVTLTLIFNLFDFFSNTKGDLKNSKMMTIVTITINFAEILWLEELIFLPVQRSYLHLIF